MLFNYFMKVLAIILAEAVLASATAVIVPLYVWPGDSASTCTAWTPLKSAIAAQPSLAYIVIVNPDSGPGGANTQPDPVYSGCIEKLKASNVIFVGYVDTKNGNRASSAITQDIATYAGWGSAYAISGIFFDDVTATKKLFSDYSGWAATAKASFNGGSGLVILNPGTGINDNDYFTIADQIMTFEDQYSDFSETDINIGTNSPASQQSVIIYAAPSTVPSSVVSELVSAGIGSFYITSLGSSDPYASLPADFASFVAIVASDQ